MLLLLCFLSCNSESADECFKTPGEKTTQEFDLENFNQIRVEGDMQLVIKQGDKQQILLKTGSNILKAVEVKVEDSLLVASYDDGCNLVRDYGVTQLLVTVPNLIKIRNASTYDVLGEGLLTFNNLTLESLTLDEDSGSFYNSGGFSLNLDAQKITLECNGKAFYELMGKTNVLSVSFVDKTARLEGADLIAQRVEIYHRSANKIIVNPQQRLEGIITGPGDIISVNKPPVVIVDERFTGKLIFKTP